MHWYFSRSRAHSILAFLIHSFSLQTERMLLASRLLYHVAMFYDFCFVLCTILSFITGIDQGCRVEYINAVIVVT